MDTLTPMLGPSLYTLIWETQPPSLLLPHTATPACIHRDTCSSLLTLRGHSLSTWGILDPELKNSHLEVVLRRVCGVLLLQCRCRCPRGMDEETDSQLPGLSLNVSGSPLTQHLLPDPLLFLTRPRTSHLPGLASGAPFCSAPLPTRRDLPRACTPLGPLTPSTGHDYSLLSKLRALPLCPWTQVCHFCRNQRVPAQPLSQEDCSAYLFVSLSAPPLSGQG